MTWINDEDIDSLINVGFLIIGGCAAISFYLDNPIWQYTMLGIIIFFVGFIDFLYNKQKHKSTEIKANAVSAETIKELELEITRLKRD